MKQLLIAVIVLLPFAAYPQNREFTPGQYVIKGTAKNMTQNFWEFGINDFFGFKTIAVPVAADGSFSCTVSATHPQDIYPIFDHDFKFFAVPGDTLIVNWDDAAIAKTFRVTSMDKERQQEIELVMEVFANNIDTARQLSEDMRNGKIQDSVKYARVVAQFTKVAKRILATPTSRYRKKILCDTYFQYLNYLNKASLIPKYEFSYKTVFGRRLTDSLGISLMLPDWISEDLFYLSAPFRDYFFDRIRFHSPFFTSTITKPPQTDEFGWTLGDCFQGAVFLEKNPPVRDWFLTLAIMEGFQRYHFKNSTEAYQIFYPKLVTPFFRDALQKFYSGIQRLRPGNPAPPFTLKNEEGKSVSLSDFKGKAVYIDFWGVYCGPCISDIKNYVPQVHEKYKGKDVVFLNICVDVDEKTWKENIKKLNLHGVNLLAVGGPQNPACKAYNVSGIPHYVLIDKEGKIVNNNATRPWDLMRTKGENEIDKALK